MTLRTKALWSLPLVLCFGLLFAARAGAQTTTTGNISGTVTDAQGAVLPGATVTAVHVATGTSYEATTNNEGHFSILNVRVGVYNVSTALSGFKDEKQEAVNVQLGVDKTVDFKMQVASVTENVNVVAQASVLDTNDAGAASNISQGVIESLPTIARSITDFARVSPFVNPTTLGSNGDQALSIAGRHNRYNNMQIDGAVNNDLFGLADTGTPGGQTGTQPISLDAIQEVQVVVSPYDVRQGGFSGGGVNVITKSGSNTISGTGYTFQRNQALIGQIPAIATVATPNPSKTKVGTFTDKQSGASLGGPIMKNKAFYFGNIDFQRKNTPSGFSADGSSGQPWDPGDQALMQQVLSISQTQYGFNPGGLSQFSRPTNNDKVFVRTDFNLSSKNRLTARVNYVNGLQYVGTPTTTNYLLPDRFYDIRDKTISSVGQLDTTISGNMFNQARVTYQRERNVRGDQPGNSAFPSTEVDFPDGNYVTFGTETSSQQNKLNQDIVEINDDLTWVKGNHTITIGTHNELFRFYNLFIQNAYGTYRFSSVANYQASLAQSYAYNYSNDPSDPLFAADFGVQQYGAYAGDLWRLKPNFTINYGSRYDQPHFPDKPSANPLAVSDFNFATNVVPAPKMISPRIGFNWDLSNGSDNRQQIRGGIGSFAGRTPYVWLSNQYGNTGVDITSISTGYKATNSIPFVADVTAQPTTVSGATAGKQTINMVDPNYKYPQILRGNLAYDRALGVWGLVGTAELVWSKTQDDVLWKDLNYAPTGAVRPDGRLALAKVDNSINDAVLLTNTNKGNTETFAFKIERPYRHGFYASGSYMYNRAKSISDGGAFVALSSWRDQYENSDPNNPALATSDYQAGNIVKLTGSVDVPMVHHLHSVLSAFYDGQTGQPYSLVFNGDANGDTTTFNDIAFLPSSADQVIVTGGTYAQLAAYLAKDPSAQGQLGTVPNRNTGTSPWTNELDVRYEINVPIKRTQVQLSMSVLNFLNLLDSSWGWHYFPNFYSPQTLGYKGIDAATGKEIIDISNITSPNFLGTFTRDDLRSRWQAQWEARIRF
ncbi:MAG: carboxypeptidase regulatory-like domain-containing protein [Vicinamibacterales bacterium]